MTFWFMQDLLKLGYQRPLEMGDLYEMGQEESAQYVSEKITRAWERELKAPKPSLSRALVRAFGAHLALAAIPDLLYTIAGFVGPYIVFALVDFFQDKNASISHALGLVALFFVVSILECTFLHQYYYYGVTSELRIRTAMSAIIYNKALQLSNKARQAKTVGEIVNLMSVDARRVGAVSLQIHWIWCSPLQIIAGLSILALRMGPWPTLVAICVMVLTTPVSALMTRFQTKVEEKVMAAKDARVKAVAEALQAMRIIKFFAWEASILAKITQLRQNEVFHLRRLKYLNALAEFFWTVNPSLVSTAFFATYVLLTTDSSPADIYSSISIINLIRFPMTVLPYTINTLISGRISKNRIEEFLMMEDLAQFERNPRKPSTSIKNAKKGKTSQFSEQRYHLLAQDEEEDDELEPNEFDQLHAALSANGLGGKFSIDEPDRLEVAQERVVARITAGDFAWDTQPILRGINLEVSEGELIVVVGHVGSGKSSLLTALINEMQKISGKLEVNGSVAYVAQSPWIINATIKDNILLGTHFDAEKYAETIKACALEQDLQILPGGDQCEIGEKGINLSGGQKQRVALARAVYKEAQLYLLDDPLSAVDSGVGQHLLHQCILSKLSDKTRILVTHQLYPLKYASRIVVMENGRISAIGTYGELTESGFNFATHIHTETTQNKDEPEKKENEPKKSTLVSVEERSTGSVLFAHYKSYFAGIGFALVVTIVILGILGYVAQLLGDWWVAKTNEGKATYFAVYLGLVGASAIALVAEAFGAAVASLKASTKFHDSVLARVFRAPVSFFDSTPVGRILNRFSRDQDTLDNELPTAMFQMLSTTLPMFTTLGLITFASPFFLLVVPFIAYFYRFIEKYYIASSRELKRLDSTSISPVYSHFTETLNGVVTIRAYKIVENYKHVICSKIDRNNRAVWAWIMLNRWLGMRLEFCGALIFSSSALFIIFSRDWLHISPILAGLTLSYTLSLAGTLNWVVREQTKQEKKRNAGKREQRKEKNGNIDEGHEIEEKKKKNRQKKNRANFCLLFPANFCEIELLPSQNEIFKPAHKNSYFLNQTVFIFY
eukprot:Phypoly_transcript_00709.p1 GENE.Phypoly_transcript_00709~~Phypoly_transcript_00709.p1  ORF type:complete len:1088 (+),score=146.03 Phypoly_transcript_00709:61-3264(+)